MIESQTLIKTGKKPPFLPNSRRTVSLSPENNPSAPSFWCWVAVKQSRDALPLDGGFCRSLN